MSAPEHRRLVGPNVIRLLVLLAFLCFVAAECVAQSWLTKGTYPEWIAAGLGLYVLAELV
jgi:hypothetical protein